MVNVFLTGASGYVGRYVLRELLRNGHRVICLVKDQDRRKDVTSFLGIETANFQFVFGEVTDLERHLRGINIDLIIHCAFDWSRPKEVEDKVTDVLCRFARQGIPVIFTSGCFVVGDSVDPQRDVWVDEETPYRPPKDLLWRAEAEQRILAIPKTIVIRPALVFGGWGSYGSQWYKDIKEGRGALSCSDDATYPWIHVEDLASFYAVAVQCLLEKGQGGLFNLGDGRKNINRKEILLAFSKLAGTDKLQEKKPSEAAWGSVLSLRQPNMRNERACQLGWRPRHGTPLEELGRWFEDVRAHEDEVLRTEVHV